MYLHIYDMPLHVQAKKKAQAAAKKATGASSGPADDVAVPAEEEVREIKEEAKEAAEGEDEEGAAGTTSKDKKKKKKKAKKEEESTPAPALPATKKKAGVSALRALVEERKRAEEEAKRQEEEERRRIEEEERRAEEEERRKEEEKQRKKEKEKVWYCFLSSLVYDSTSFVRPNVSWRRKRVAFLRRNKKRNVRWQRFVDKLFWLLGSKLRVCNNRQGAEVLKRWCTATERRSRQQKRTHHLRQVQGLDHQNLPLQKRRKKRLNLIGKGATTARKMLQRRRSRILGKLQVTTRMQNLLHPKSRILGMPRVARKAQVRHHNWFRRVNPTKHVCVVL